MPDSLLIENGTVVTLGECNRVLADHAVLCVDGLITKIAPSSDFAGQRFGTTLDARGQVVMPGFINTHMHFYSTMVRGLGKAKPSKTFLEVLENLWWRLDKKLTLEDCYYSALVPLLDAIRHGTTTLIDHHASPFAVRGSLDVIAKAVKQAGLRASLCYEVSDRDGAAVAAQGIEENLAFLARVQRERDPQLQALFGLHAQFTLTDATLARAARAAHDVGAGFHIHVAEAASDEEACVATHGCRVVERLQRAGILGPKTIAAHCVHVDEREMQLLAASDTPVVHNPQSNMNNAVGVADVLGLAHHGVLVGLGTDAMTVNMLEELRAGLWVRHLATRDPNAGFMETLGTLVTNNAKIANRHFAPRVGELAPGCAADVICIDYAPPTEFSEQTFLGHLAFGLSQATVDTTIASGKVLMHHKTLLLDLDEEQIAARTRELAAALWARF